MPKIRALKPETWTDSKVVRLTPLARLLFLGSWNYACDNGHLDDDPMELKMRILPADNCDVSELLDEIVALNMMERSGGRLKVARLGRHQKIDLRYLALCEWCESDPDCTFLPEDRILRGPRAQRAPGGHTTGAQRVPATDGDGDGDGDGDVGAAKPATPRKRGTRLPDDWTPSDDLKRWTSEECPGLNGPATAAKFRDYWHGVAGAKGLKVDWDATWRNWCRNEYERSAR